MLYRMQRATSIFARMPHRSVIGSLIIVQLLLGSLFLSSFWNVSQHSVLRAQAACGTGEILFVSKLAGSGAITQRDRALVARLQIQGYTLTLVRDTDVTAADAAGKSLIIVSEASDSPFIEDTFRDVAVPFVTWEGYLYDNMGMTQNVLDTHYGLVSDQTSIDVINSAHPLAAGLSGVVVTQNQDMPFQWGVPDTTAIKIATLVGSPDKFAIFAYEAGASMFGFTAPARRVGIPSATGGALNDDGWSYVDAAIKWAQDCTVAPTPTLINTVVITDTETPTPVLITDTPLPATDTPVPVLVTDTPLPATNTPEPPTATPIETPTLLPTQPPLACAGLEQEAEAGVLYGDFEVGIDTNASGGAYVHVLQDTHDEWDGANPLHRVDYCFTVPEAGSYVIYGIVMSLDQLSDSFYVSVDGVPDIGYMWGVSQELNNTYVLDYVNDRDNAIDPVTVSLTAGRHLVSIYLREDATRLDTIGLELVPIIPDTPTPLPDTPTPLPDTPTPLPDTPTSLPDTPTSVFDTPTPEPATPTPEPNTPTPEPATPTPEPNTSTPESATPTQEPNTSTPESATPTQEPNTSTPEPATPTPTFTPTPSAVVTEEPTTQPTEVPTQTPTSAPGETAAPTNTPTAIATFEPLPPSLQIELVDNLLVDADGDGIPSPGDTIEYAVVIKNSGELSATGVEYASLIDANMTLLDINLPQGEVILGNEPNASELMLRLDDIPGGNGQIEFTYTVELNNPLPASITEIEHFGIVSLNELPDRVTDDPDLAGQFDATTISINANPLLRVSMNDLLLIDADKNEAVSSGDVLLFLVDVTNIGNAAATSIVIENEIDPNTTLVPNSVRTEQGSVTSGNSIGEDMVLINIDSLAGGGESVRASFQLIVNDNLETQQIVHQAITSNNGGAGIEGASAIFSDDPDTAEVPDSTITLLLTKKNTNFATQIYVPIIEK